MSIKESPIQTLRKKAFELGFVAMGITVPDTPPQFDRFVAWIGKNRHGEMAWLKRRTDLRENPAALLDGCRTIISLAYPYSSNIPATADGLVTARYTEPGQPDYHDRLKQKGRELAQVLCQWDPGCTTRICVDSAPLLERSIAAKAGLGFIGRNNSLIVPGIGSYVFLGEILTTADLTPYRTDSDPVPDGCGTCRRCLAACPTGALDGPFSMDAGKCLSYLTVEYPGEIGKGDGKMMGDCFMGCDRCQEVCPCNDQTRIRTVILPSSDEFLAIDDARFRILFGKTALNRPGLDRIKRNIRLIK